MLNPPDILVIKDLVSTPMYLLIIRKSAVYYWSSKPDKEGKQTAYVYASTSNERQ